ncbi:redox-sensing transcriptional repressor Rex [Oceanivirga miroungae]|uniref:Redox-sensing transcriptional repressor Rex n=1 Tax=Oceanivirga miroungae TaxID=1130046 RepID=A0A6I8MB64_9FUSO|nr:redox-sensing transcriptional repressor Rex [Oceanivirga miroungae]VWL85479.1 redox-sensing transcriptional repressor Rex [Oceanivirga miroungae]
MHKKIKYDSKDISSKMVRRLTKYLRVLKDIKKKKDRVNSVELATKMNTTASQVRKDLSTFGEFGVRSKGYDLDHLINIIESILGIDEDNKVIIIGFGNMGRLLSSNTDVLGKGFVITGIFDNNKDKIGTKVEKIGLEVLDYSQVAKFIKEEKITSCILAVNREFAQEVSEELIEYGIKAILNLTTKRLHLPEDIATVEIDFSIKLQELNFWRKYKNIKYGNN